MRVRAPLERQVEHSRELDVLRIAALAGDQRRIFDAAYRRADESGVIRGHDETLAFKRRVRGSCCAAILDFGLPILDCSNENSEL
jgi:hypothetical protein